MRGSRPGAPPAGATLTPEGRPVSESWTLRRLAVDDYDAIVSLWQRAGPSVRLEGRDAEEEFAKQMTGGAQTVIGLEQGGGLIGVVIATHDGRKGWINRLSVHPNHRYQGHGARLIAEAERALQAQGVRVIAALIEDWNQASLALFQREGYVLHKNIYYLSKREGEEV
jgi:ribosomal protein S18 acetylase RimI-like enzyme